MGGTFNNSHSFYKCMQREIGNPITITATSIGEGSNDRINSIVKTSDGGYIIGGEGEVGLRKYTSASELEWSVSDIIANVILETKDMGYIVGESNKINKYNSLGELEWTKSIGESNSDYINSVTELSDGGYIIGGSFEGRITVGSDTLTSNGSYDGLLIKVSERGEVERVTSFGGNDEDEITSVTATSDGGYVVGGNFKSSSIEVGDYKFFNDSIEEYNKLYSFGLLVKYGANNEIEWADERSNEQITSVLATNEGGYLVGSCYKCEDER